MSVSGSVFGRGRGRGRRPALEVLVNEQCKIQDGESNKIEALAIQNGYGDSVDGCAAMPRTHFTADTSLNAITLDAYRSDSKENLIVPAPLLSSAPTPREIITTAGNVPEEYIGTKERLTVSVAEVDMSSRLVYIIFTDEKTKIFGRLFSSKLNRFYKTYEFLNQINIDLDDVQPEELVVAADMDGRFHRASRSITKNSFMVDLDTREIFSVDKNAIYKMLPEFKEVWLQAVKCRVTLQNGPRENSWRAENRLILNKSYLLERCILSAIELDTKALNGVSQLERTEEKNVLKLPIDICMTEDFNSSLIKSFVFFTIPRIPTVGTAKIAVITNIKKDGLIDVIFHDNVSSSLREMVKDFAEVHTKSAATNPIYLKLITNYHVRDFVVSSGNQWSRAKVLSIDNDKEEMEMHFVDTGKQKCVPLKDLVMPLRSSSVPELLEHIYPQAVTIQLKGWNNSDDNNLNMENLQIVLEGKPCYVEVVNDKGNVPIAELWMNVTGDHVMSVIDYLHDRNIGAPDDKYAIPPLKHLVKQLEKFNITNTCV